MPRFKSWACVLCIVPLLLFLTATHISTVSCTSREDAEHQIETAESEVLKCYAAVFEAEKAGANVSIILEALNRAGWLLSKAKLAYSNGDFNSASTYASECCREIEGVASKAEVLKAEAEKTREQDFKVNYVMSAAGSLTIVAVGWAVWFFLKKREKPNEV